MLSDKKNKNMSKESWQKMKMKGPVQTVYTPMYMMPHVSNVAVAPSPIAVNPSMMTPRKLPNGPPTFNPAPSFCLKEKMPMRPTLNSTSSTNKKEKMQDISKSLFIVAKMNVSQSQTKMLPRSSGPNSSPLLSPRSSGPNASPSSSRSNTSPSISSSENVVNNLEFQTLISKTNVISPLKSLEKIEDNSKSQDFAAENGTQFIKARTNLTNASKEHDVLEEPEKNYNLISQCSIKNSLKVNNVKNDVDDSQLSSHTNTDAKISETASIPNMVSDSLMTEELCNVNISSVENIKSLNLDVIIQSSSKEEEVSIKINDIKGKEKNKLVNKINVENSLTNGQPLGSVCNEKGTNQDEIEGKRGLNTQNYKMNNSLNSVTKVAFSNWYAIGEKNIDYNNKSGEKSNICLEKIPKSVDHPITFENVKHYDNTVAVKKRNLNNKAIFKNWYAIKDNKNIIKKPWSNSNSPKKSTKTWCVPDLSRGSTFDKMLSNTTACDRGFKDTSFNDNSNSSLEMNQEPQNIYGNQFNKQSISGNKLEKKLDELAFFDLPDTLESTQLATLNSNISLKDLQDVFKDSTSLPKMQDTNIKAKDELQCLDNEINSADGKMLYILDNVNEKYLPINEGNNVTANTSLQCDQLNILNSIPILEHSQVNIDSELNINEFGDNEDLGLFLGCEDIDVVVKDLKFDNIFEDLLAEEEMMELEMNEEPTFPTLIPSPLPNDGKESEKVTRDIQCLTDESSKNSVLDGDTFNFGKNKPGYHLFYAEKESFVVKDSTIKSCEVPNLISHEWKQLKESERKKYDERAKNTNINLRNLNRTADQTNHSTSILLKQMANIRKKVIDKNLDCSFEEISQLIATEWKEHIKSELNSYTSEDLDGSNIEAKLDLLPFPSDSQGTSRKRIQQLTGYNLYWTEVRKSLIDKNPNANFGAISKLIGNEWKALSELEQKVYNDKAQKENSLKVTGKTSGDAFLQYRRAQNVTGYVIFCAEIRKSLAAKNQDADFGEISRLVGSKWKNLPDNEKRIYNYRAYKANLIKSKVKNGNLNNTVHNDKSKRECSNNEKFLEKEATDWLEANYESCSGNVVEQTVVLKHIKLSLKNKRGITNAIVTNCIKKLFGESDSSKFGLRGNKKLLDKFSDKYYTDIRKILKTDHISLRLETKSKTMKEDTGKKLNIGCSFLNSSLAVAESICDTSSIHNVGEDYKDKILDINHALVVEKSLNQANSSTNGESDCAGKADSMNPDQVYSCGDCDARFPNTEQLIIHAHVHEDIVSQKPEDSQEIDDDLPNINIEKVLDQMEILDHKKNQETLSQDLETELNKSLNKSNTIRGKDLTIQNPGVCEICNKKVPQNAFYDKFLRMYCSLLCSKKPKQLEKTKKETISTLPQAEKGTTPGRVNDAPRLVVKKDLFAAVSRGKSEEKTESGTPMAPEKEESLANEANGILKLVSNEKDLEADEAKCYKIALEEAMDSKMRDISLKIQPGKEIIPYLLSDSSISAEEEKDEVETDSSRSKLETEKDLLLSNDEDIVKLVLEEDALVVPSSMDICDEEVESSKDNSVSLVKRRRTFLHNISKENRNGKKIMNKANIIYNVNKRKSKIMNKTIIYKRNYMPRKNKKPKRQYQRKYLEKRKNQWTNKKPKRTKLEEMEEIFHVEKILHHRDNGGRREYFIKWEGYGPADSTWEPEENLIDCYDLLQQYKERKIERICYSRERCGSCEYLIKWADSSACHSTWEPLEHVIKLNPDLLQTFLETQVTQHDKNDKGKEQWIQFPSLKSMMNPEEEQQSNNGSPADSNNIVTRAAVKVSDVAVDEKIVTQFGLLNDLISDLVCPKCNNNTLTFRKKGKTRFVISSLELHCQKCEENKRIQEEMKEIEDRRKQVEIQRQKDERNISERFICDIKKEKFENEILRQGGEKEAFKKRVCDIKKERLERNWVETEREDDEKEAFKKLVCDIKKERLEHNLTDERTEMPSENMETEPLIDSCNIKVELSDCTQNSSKAKGQNSKGKSISPKVRLKQVNKPRKGSNKRAEILTETSLVMKDDVSGMCEMSMKCEERNLLLNTADLVNPSDFVNPGDLVSPGLNISSQWNTLPLVFLPVMILPLPKDKDALSVSKNTEPVHLPLPKETMVVPLSKEPDVLLSSEWSDPARLPLSKEKLTIPLTKETDIVSLSKREDPVHLPLSKETMVVPLLKEKNILSLSKKTDLVDCDEDVKIIDEKKVQSGDCMEDVPPNVGIEKILVQTELLDNNKNQEILSQDFATELNKSQNENDTIKGKYSTILQNPSVCFICNKKGVRDAFYGKNRMYCSLLCSKKTKTMLVPCPEKTDILASAKKPDIVNYVEDVKIIDVNQVESDTIMVFTS